MLGTSCTNCPRNTFKEGSNNASICSNCPTGSVSNPGTQSASACVCEDGYSATTVDGVAACEITTECALGQYVSDTMQGGKFLCSQCPSGQFKAISDNRQGSGSCTACPARSSSPAGSDAASDCLCNVGQSGIISGTANASGTCTDASERKATIAAVTFLRGMTRAGFDASQKQAFRRAVAASFSSSTYSISEDQILITEAQDELLSAGRLKVSFEVQSVPASEQSAIQSNIKAVETSSDAQSNFISSLHSNGAESVSDVEMTASAVSSTPTCDPGFHLSGVSSCAACPMDTFKAGSNSATACKDCPEHSSSSGSGSIAASDCKCSEGYEGTITGTDSASGECTASAEASFSASDTEDDDVVASESSDENSVLIQNYVVPIVIGCSLLLLVAAVFVTRKRCNSTGVSPAQSSSDRERRRQSSKLSEVDDDEDEEGNGIQLHSLADLSQGSHGLNTGKRWSGSAPSPTFKRSSTLQSIDEDEIETVIA